MVALWGCFLNVFVFIIVFLLVRSLREWVCHLQRWQLLIVASNEAKFDFQPALMRMNIHWRVRGSLVRNGWWIPHYPIWTTWPPNQLSYSSFPFLPNATNKVTHKQMTTTHHITSFGRPGQWPLNQRKVSQISTLLPPRFCSCCSYTYFLFWKRRCHFLIWASGHIFCSSSWWLTCPSWPGGRQQFSLSFHPSNITFVLSYRCTKTKTSGAL